MKLQQLRRRLRRLQEVQLWEPGGIRASVVRREGRPAVKEDRVDFYRWLWLIDGTAVCTDEHGQRYEMKPGDCFIRAPDQYHCVERPVQHNYLELALVVPRIHWHSFCESALIHPDQRFVRLGSDEHLIDVFWNWFSALDNNDSIHDQAKKMHYLIELFTLLHPQSRQRNNKDLKVLRKLQRALSSPTDWQTPLETIAARHDISMDKMRQLFKQSLGCLPKDFHMRRRCEAAANLLLDPQLSISGVAETMDYADPFSFSKQFRKVMGISPRSYRKRHLS